MSSLWYSYWRHTTDNISEFKMYILREAGISHHNQRTAATVCYDSRLPGALQGMSPLIASRIEKRAL